LLRNPDVRVASADLPRSASHSPRALTHMTATINQLYLRLPASLTTMYPAFSLT
jgi:hypothetical protein